tara:strand:- start:1181 stop:2446 length:1266 start_codon:yes stop_codon:yes gene_type:complete
MKLSIHGKIYDLTQFADEHPGGRQILELCSKEPDCTALFESYHAFCDMVKIKSIMKLYETDETAEQMFKIEKNGFYNTCKNRVRSYFGNSKSLRTKIKANYLWLISVMITVIFFVICQYGMLSQESIILGCVCGLISGFSLGSLGYNLLHDGSHYAVSTLPLVNQLLSKVIQSLLLWNHALWSYHHCIRHHQYTGNINLDPDMRHNYPMIRKSTLLKKRERTLSKSNFSLKMLIFNIFLPGSAIGQSISYYLVWLIKKKLWKMKLPSVYYKDTKIWEYLLSIMFCMFHIIHGNILFLYFHFIGTNLIYFIGLSPDHDMYVTHLEIEKLNKLETNSVDWGEMQVRTSANFCNSYTNMTKFMGGINYQIEHHLFPTVCNHHLKDISYIVKQTCKEFNIPYNSIDNPINVYRSIMKMYKKVLDE